MVQRDWDSQSQKDCWGLKHCDGPQSDVLALGGVVLAEPIVPDSRRSFWDGRVERENCDTSDDSTNV